MKNELVIHVFFLKTDFSFLVSPQKYNCQSEMLLFKGGSPKITTSIPTNYKPDMFLKYKPDMFLKYKPDMFLKYKPNMFLKYKPDMFLKYKPDMFLKLTSLDLLGASN